MFLTNFIESLLDPLYGSMLVQETITAVHTCNKLYTVMKKTNASEK